MRMSDPRTDFVRQCAPFTWAVGRILEEVCGCLHDHAAAAVDDVDLREAFTARHQRDRRAHHRDPNGCRRRSKAEIGPTFTEDCPAHPAMHVRSGDELIDHPPLRPRLSLQRHCKVKRSPIIIWSKHVDARVVSFLFPRGIDCAWRTCDRRARRGHSGQGRRLSRRDAQELVF